MTAGASERVSIPVGWLWLIRLICPVLGVGLAFAVRPVVGWLVSTVSSAPGPLRLAAEIPTTWLVPTLAVVGIAVGYWLSEQAKRDSLALTVDDESLVTAHRDSERYIQRSQVGSVFTDPGDFVVLDPHGREIFRAPATDLPEGNLAAALRRHGYPWRGNSDPHEAEYHRWIDGHPDLDQETNALLRARRRARDSGNRAEAEEIHAQLQDHGIIVRDRDKTQEYRRLTDTSKDSAP